MLTKCTVAMVTIDGFHGVVPGIRSACSLVRINSWLVSCVGYGGCGLRRDFFSYLKLPLYEFHDDRKCICKKSGLV